MSTPDQYVTRTEFAALRGCGKSYVTKLDKQGKLVLSGDGKLVNVAATLRRLDESSDPGKDHVAQRHADARTHRDVGQHIQYTAPNDVPGRDAPANGEATFYANKSRREAALAEMAELELQSRLGKFVDREQVELAIEALHRMLRDSLLGLPTRLAPEFAAMTDPFLIEQKFRDGMRSLLDDLSRMTAQSLQEGGGSKH